LETLIKQIQTVCQALAFGIYDTERSFPIIGNPDYPTLSEKNLIVETMHALNRSTPYREQLIPNDVVKTAIGYTLHWLDFYRLPVNEQQISNTPEWGREYIK